MTKQNYLFKETEMVTREVNIRKTLNGDKEFESEKTIAKGYFNGKPVISGVLKFGPGFEVQAEENKKRNVS